MPGWLDWLPRKVLLFFWKHNHLGSKPELLCLSCSNSCCVQHHKRTGKAMLLNCNYLSKMRASLKSATGSGNGPEKTFLPSIREALYSTSTQAKEAAHIRATYLFGSPTCFCSPVYFIPNESCLLWNYI